jgi:hypothetical protein
MDVLEKPLPAIFITELLSLTQVDKPEMVERGNNANNALIAYFTRLIGNSTHALLQNSD